jgi:hypothetical protein
MSQFVFVSDFYGGIPADASLMPDIYEPLLGLRLTNAVSPISCGRQLVRESEFMQPVSIQRGTAVSPACAI